MGVVFVFFFQYVKLQTAQIIQAPTSSWTNAADQDLWKSFFYHNFYG